MVLNEETDGEDGAFPSDPLPAPLPLARLARAGSTPRLPHTGPPGLGSPVPPELSAAYTRGYIEAKRHDMLAEGLDPDRLHTEVRETPWGREILARFTRLAAG